MALYLSASTAVVGQQVSQSNDFTVHALRRTVDGMLHYTHGRSTDQTATFDYHRTDGSAYDDFLEGDEYIEAAAGAKAYSNHTHDKYQQFRFDFRNLTYFIDDEGYLVARLNKTYDHTTNGPK